MGVSGAANASFFYDSDGKMVIKEEADGKAEAEEKNSDPYQELNELEDWDDLPF